MLRAGEEGVRGNTWVAWGREGGRDIIIAWILRHFLTLAKPDRSVLKVVLDATPTFMAVGGVRVSTTPDSVSCL